jgi:hypothetical protein
MLNCVLVETSVFSLLGGKQQVREAKQQETHFRQATNCVKCKDTAHEWKEESRSWRTCVPGTQTCWASNAVTCQCKLPGRILVSFCLANPHSVAELPRIFQQRMTTSQRTANESDTGVGFLERKGIHRAIRVIAVRYVIKGHINHLQAAPTVSHSHRGYAKNSKNHPSYLSVHLLARRPRSLPPRSPRGRYHIKN